MKTHVRKPNLSDTPKHRRRRTSTKPWSLEVKLAKTPEPDSIWFRWYGDWSSVGKYETKERAEQAMADQSFYKSPEFLKRVRRRKSAKSPLI